MPQAAASRFLRGLDIGIDRAAKIAEQLGLELQLRQKRAILILAEDWPHTPVQVDKITKIRAGKITKITAAGVKRRTSDRS